MRDSSVQLSPNKYRYSEQTEKRGDNDKEYTTTKETTGQIQIWKQARYLTGNKKKLQKGVALNDTKKYSFLQKNISIIFDSIYDARAYKAHPQFSRAYSGEKSFQCISIFQHSSFIGRYHYITKIAKAIQSTYVQQKILLSWYALIIHKLTTQQFSTSDNRWCWPANSPRCLLFEQLVYHKYRNSLRYFFSIWIVIMQDNNSQ